VNVLGFTVPKENRMQGKRKVSGQSLRYMVFVVYLMVRHRNFVPYCPLIVGKKSKYRKRSSNPILKRSK
jgi:hypothetical protein